MQQQQAFIKKTITDLLTYLAGNMAWDLLEKLEK